MKLLLNSVALLIFTGCNVINPDEQEPSFVFIDSYSFQPQAGQGSSSTAITELWNYANDDIQGVFDLPAQIPVLRTGLNKYSVYAGIKNNGMSSTRIRYPFYAVYDTILDLQPLQSYHITPRFQYHTAAQVNATRDFEAGNFFQAGPNNGATIEVINNPTLAVDGDRFGKIILTPPLNYMSFIDNSNIVMQAGNTIFIEMNYSCNNTFIVGTFTVENGDTRKNPVIYLTPTNTDGGDTPTWKKIYIDLGIVAGENPNADYHRLYVECISSETESPVVFLDNIKIVNW